jgi:hypothetical protein
MWGQLPKPALCVEGLSGGLEAPDRSACRATDSTKRFCHSEARNAEESAVATTTKSSAQTPQPRSGERMQPTAQAVGSAIPNHASSVEAKENRAYKCDCLSCRRDENTKEKRHGRGNSPKSVAPKIKQPGPSAAGRNARNAVRQAGSRSGIRCTSWSSDRPAQDLSASAPPMRLPE